MRLLFLSSHRILAWCLVLSAQLLSVAGRDLRISWDRNGETNAAGYILYYGTSAGTYAYQTNVGNVTNINLSGFDPGRTYFFSATAYDSSGVESLRASEVAHAVSPILIGASSLSLTSGIPNQRFDFIFQGGEFTSAWSLGALSGNSTLIPLSGIQFGGSSSNRYVEITPVDQATGSTTLTLFATDGVRTNSLNLSATVFASAVNVSPTLDTIASLSLAEDAPSQTISLSGISSGSANEAQTLVVSAISSNTGLIPNPTVSYASPATTGSLSFAPVANANGSALITVTVNDGQSANNLFSRTFTVTVAAVNDPPTLNALADLTLAEDAPPQTINLAGIGSGSANEAQTLVVSATSSNTGLIPNPTVSYTSPAATGSLSFTPVANASGSATITVTVNDGQSANNLLTRTFTVTVNAINDPPTLGAISARSISEDAGLQTVSLSGIGSGASNEVQTLTVSAVSSDTTIIPNPTVTYTSPNTTGTLSFSPATNANGVATITVTVNDGQVANNSVSRSFSVTVNPVNDPPKLDPISNLTLPEDPGQQTVNLTGIGSGAANETQTLIVTASSSNTGVIPNPAIVYTSPNNTGSLTFTPVPNASGTATITVNVNDGQTVNSLITRTFTVTVSAVNDAPTLDAIADRSLLEDAGAQTVNLTGIGSGAANESQSLTVTASSSNTGLIPNPTVTYTSPSTTGSIRFTPVANANGTATITVSVRDGQATNGVTARTFNVVVSGVNDPPTLNAITGLTLNEDAPSQLVNLSGITAGNAQESQTLTVTASSSNPGLIPNPVVSYLSPNTTGTLSFAPVTNANGVATITVTVDDGQGINNLISKTFAVTVNPVNDPPTLATVPDIVIAENSPAQTVALTGIGSGAANETQLLSLTATSSDPALIPTPSVSYTSPNASGSLTFRPAANSRGVATLTVRLDDGQPTNNFVLRSFRVTVDGANSAPTLNPISNLTLNEDPGPQVINLTGISSGSVIEQQTLVVSARSSDPAILPDPIVTYTSPSATGTLLITPNPNANGTVTVTVAVNDGGSTNNQITRSFTVSLAPVNDAPGLASIPDLTIDEDAGPQTVNLSGIHSGAANEVQTLVVTASSDSPELIPNPSVSYTSPGTGGSLQFTPLLNAYGTATITVTVNDGQSVQSSVSRTFTVTVNPVNDPPTLDPIADLTTAADAGQHTVQLTGISSGVANEIQTLTVSASSSDPTLIPDPVITYTTPATSGSLTFTPSLGRSGTVTITVSVNDGQSVSNSIERTFTVVVNAVNTAPVVSVGTNTSVKPNVTFMVRARITDDGLPVVPGRTTARWSKISGPGTVTFGNSNSAITTLNFSAQGIYRLRLTGFDGELYGSADLLIFVRANQDTTAPVISQVQITDVTSGSATVNWRTDEPTSGQVEITTQSGTKTFTLLKADLTLSNSVIVTNLASSTIYTLRARSRDAAGNGSYSAPMTLSTLAASTQHIPLTLTQADITAPAILQQDVYGAQFVSFPTANSGGVRFPFYSPSSSPLHTWIRMLAPSANSDTLSLSLDGGPSQMFVLANNSTNTWSTRWQWVRLGTMSMSLGIHELLIQGIETGVAISRALITNDPRFVPSDSDSILGFGSALSQDNPIYAMTIQSGWSMLSCPLSPPSSGIPSLFGSAPAGSKVLKWDADSGSFVTNDFDGQVWSVPSMTLSAGVWIRFYNPGNPFVWAVSGTELPDLSPTLQPGMNLVVNSPSAAGIVSQILPDVIFHSGDRILLLRSLSGNFSTCTFDGVKWDVYPSVNLGEPFYLDLAP